MLRQVSSLNLNLSLNLTGIIDSSLFVRNDGATESLCTHEW
jgi:hypothetical protein